MEVTKKISFQNKKKDFFYWGVAGYVERVDLDLSPLSITWSRHLSLDFDNWPCKQSLPFIILILAC